MAQGFITDAALRKAEQAGESGLARFVVRLSDGLLPPSEIEALNDLGMVEFLPFFRQAMVALPGRQLLDLADCRPLWRSFNSDELRYYLRVSSWSVAPWRSQRASAKATRHQPDHPVDNLRMGIG